MTQTVRRFSAAGPCIVRGELVKETAKFYVYRDRFHGGEEKRIGKDQYGMVHIDPCVSCRDHQRTQYPDGYMD